MDEYTVDFRIYGESLNPLSVSADLGLEASQIIEVGDNRSATSRWEKAMWGYNGLGLNGGAKIWESLEEGLTFLLDKLTPLKERIASYGAEFELVFWCGHFQDSFCEGPSFSPGLLKRLGEFGVEVVVHNYFCSSEENEAAEC